MLLLLVFVGQRLRSVPPSDERPISEESSSHVDSSSSSYSVATAAPATTSPRHSVWYSSHSPGGAGRSSCCWRQRPGRRRVWQVRYLASRRRRSYAETRWRTSADVL